MSTQSLRKSTLYLMGSQLVFILSNYIIHIVLAHYLGQEAYGLFGVLMSLYLINRAFLNTGIPKAVSTFLAQAKYSFPSVLRISFNVQFVFGILFALVYILLASPLARILQDTALIPYIRYLGIIILPLALASLFLNGYLNGLHLFKQQAIAKIIYPLSRVGFSLLFVFLGYALYGALTGYLVATLVLILVAAYFLLKEKKSYLPDLDTATQKKFHAKQLLLFSLPITIAALASSLIRNINILFIKSILIDNIIVALYTAAATLSNIPLLLFTAIPMVLLPAASKAYAQGDIAKTTQYVQSSIRYLFLLGLPVLALILPTTSQFITFFYPAEYAAAAPVFGILLVASMFLAIYSVYITITTAIGKPSKEAYSMFIVLIVLSILNYLLIPTFGLLGAAYSFLISTLIAVIIALIWVKKAFGKLTSTTFWLSLTRILAVSIILYFGTSYLTKLGWNFILVYAIMSLLYFVLLFLIKEISKQELQDFMKIAKRKK